eukprot:9047368-Lingulodinium_polyedra.AAC.1
MHSICARRRRHPVRSHDRLWRRPPVRMRAMHNMCCVHSARGTALPGCRDAHGRRAPGGGAP